MPRVLLEIITMAGTQFVVYEREGKPVFPHGEPRDGEAPAQAARRIVQEWTGTQGPKLELVDLQASAGTLTLIFRAVLVDEPRGGAKRINRMELPARVGTLEGKYVDDALKTSLSYKLTRV